MGKTKDFFSGVLRWSAYILLTVVLLFALLVLIIRIPSVQTRIIHKVTDVVSTRTGADFRIDKLYLTYSGGVEIRELYLGGLGGDTIVHATELSTGIAILPIFNGTYQISHLSLNGGTVNLIRGEDSLFNYDFIIKALSSKDLSTVQSDTATSEQGTKKAPQLAAGPLHLSNFKFTYLDSVSGMVLKTQVRELKVLPDVIDLNTMRFSANQISLNGSRTSFYQYKASIPSTDSSAILLPQIAWKHIDIQDSYFEYNSLPDQQHLTASLEKVELGNSVLELADSSLQIGPIELDALDFYYAQEASENNTSSVVVDTSKLSLPYWKIDLAGLSIHHSNLRYSLSKNEVKDGFDPLNLSLSDLELVLEESTYQPEALSIKLTNLSTIISDDFLINQLSFEAQANEEQLNIADLSIKTNGSAVYSTQGITYNSINDLLSHPDHFNKINVSFDRISTVDLKEVLYFQPSLDSISAFHNIALHPISIAGDIHGSLADINLDQLNISALSASKIKVNGNIKGLPNQDQISLDNLDFMLLTTASDLALFIDTSGIILPSELALEGQLTGNVDLLNTNFILSTELGKILADLELKNLENFPAYKGQVQVVDLDISTLANVDFVKPITSTINFDGSGTELSTLSLLIDFQFDSLIVNELDFHTLLLKADLDSHRINLNLENNSDELIVQALLDGYLDSLASDLRLNVNLEGADLQKLGLSQGPLKSAFKLKSGFKGSPDDFEFRTMVDQIMIIGNGQVYRPDSLFMSLKTRPDSTNFDLHTAIVRGALQSNCSLLDLSQSLQHLTGFTDTSEYTMSSDFVLNASIEVNDNPLLSEILLPQLEKMDTIKFLSEFKPERQELSGQLSIPFLNYADREIEDFQLYLNASNDSTELNLGFDHVKGKWLNMGKTKVGMQRYLNMGSGYILVNNPDGSTDYHLEATFKKELEEMNIHIVEDSLILNTDSWQIDPKNNFGWDKSGYSINNFDLAHDNQHLRIESDETGQDIDILFKEFELKVLFALLNNEQDLIAGKLDGSFKTINILETPGFLADLEIVDLQLLDQEVGKLSLDASKDKSEEFTLDLLLAGPEIDFSVNGRYNTSPDQQELSMQAKLTRLGLPLVESLYPDVLDSSTGSLNALLTLEGSLRNPSYQGSIGFTEVSFDLRQLGGKLSIDDATISVSNEGLIFNRFEIIDEAGNKAAITGNINTENPLNPAFDLGFNAQNFQLLKAAEGSNELYFGEVRADMDIKVNGDLNLPLIQSRVVLRDETDFTYIVPGSTAQLESRGGIVVFEDMQDTLKFMTIDKNDQSKTIRGLDLDSRIILKDGTQLRMILDPRSGDNLSIQGAADLKYHLSPNGNMSLTGNYILNGGGYKLNLFDLVKKEFNIKPASKIVWSGSPMGADLNITALYESRTSAASLMNDPDPRFNRVFPFQVLLFIRGTVDQPEISFALDMPADLRGVLAGDVYSKIRQVNQNESELNKQVFGLIVFDRFIPSSESGDAGVSTADIALSSVSGFVSSQLNSLSSKYLKGVELDVNIGSYTDYGMSAGQQRTDLNVTMKKAFFDDRFIVEMGSNVALQGYQASNQIMGDVALEYKLTEDGRYRLRGYRRNDFENPIEGQVIITGLGLIFSREFNNWDELFDRPVEADTSNTVTPATVDD